MMDKRRTLFVALVTFFVCLAMAQTAAAQDSPFSGKKRTVDELIDSGGFTKSPLKLPFKEKSNRTVTNYGRLDFEHTYAAKYADVVKLFSDKYAKKDNKLEILDKSAHKIAGSKTVAVVGGSTDVDKATFTLAVPKNGRKFVVDIEARGNEVVVTLRNTVITDLYSGLVPARVGFKPKDAKPVPFRWN